VFGVGRGKDTVFPEALFIESIFTVPTLLPHQTPHKIPWNGG